MLRSLQLTLINQGIVLKEQLIRGIGEERGDFLGTMGWMAVAATVLVLAHGLITGWLPSFTKSIFSTMESLV